jgi:type I restriction enzyme R subunit
VPSRRRQRREQWRGILDYFLPGRAARADGDPKRKHNADTYAYFGEPVYTYALKEGINDGFLTPFKVRQIATTLDAYVYTPTTGAGRRSRGRSPSTPRTTSTASSSKSASATGCRLFMEMIDQREKTLVFCATQDHAAGRARSDQSDQDQHRPRLLPARHGQRRRLGRAAPAPLPGQRENHPDHPHHVAKALHGVDARNMRNIVLMRPIRSMIEFKQIIGRGTRVYDGKDYFTIYDFVKALRTLQRPGMGR